MSSYIKAEPGLNHTILYTDDSGRHFRFSGGTWTWRNHNPGNLFPASVSARHNQIGRTPHFAIFPDYNDGHLALLDCLKTTYGDKPIDYLVKKFAPASDGNDEEGYIKLLRDKTGITDDKKIKDFTPDEFEKLWRGIEKMEGYQEGTIIEVFPIIGVHKDKYGVCEFNIQTKGWTTKNECIQLTEQGVLDLVVCLSQLGHKYLRAREGSSINGCLDKLVVKETSHKSLEHTAHKQSDKEKANVAF